MKSIFFKRFTLILAVIIIGHLILVSTHTILGQIKEALLIDSVISAIFILGLLIIIPGFKGDPDNFALRFIGLTTLQMLTMLALIAYVIVGKLPDFRYWGFSAISIFVFLLACQSVLLIREINKNKN